MTLDEAISHAMNRANQDCSECAKEHKQLADWLMELKGYRESFYSNCIVEAIKAKIHNKNCKLYFIMSKVDGVPCPHCFWLIDDYYYNFYTDEKVHLWNVLFHRGHIAKYHVSKMHRKLHRFL